MSSKGKPKRLGGEFYKPVERHVPSGGVEEVRALLDGDAYRADSSINVKRELFLLEVEKLEPELKEAHGAGVLESLHTDVFSAYAENNGGDFILYDWPKAVKAHHADTLTGYSRELLAWQHRWNLVAPWVKDAALDTLRAWSDGEAEPGYYRGNALEWQMHLAENGGAWSSETITTKELLRGSPKRFSYDPFSMSRADAEAKFAAWQETQARRFTAFLNAQNKRAKTTGGERTKATRQHAKFEWLARYQLLGWGDNEILRHTPDTDLMLDAVRKSRERLAEEIGLPLR